MWPWGRRPDPAEHLAVSNQNHAVLTAVVAQLDHTLAELKEITAELKAVTVAERGRSGSGHAE